MRTRTQHSCRRSGVRAVAIEHYGNSKRIMQRITSRRSDRLSMRHTANPDKMAVLLRSPGRAYTSPRGLALEHHPV